MPDKELKEVRLLEWNAWRWAEEGATGQTSNCPRHEVFGLRQHLSFHQQPQSQRCGHGDAALKPWQLADQKPLNLLARQAEEHDVTPEVEAASAGPSSLLLELHGAQIDGVPCKDGGLRRHVDAECQGGRRHHDTQALHAKQALHHLGVS